MMANDSGRSLDAEKGSSSSRKVDTSGLRRSNRGAYRGKVTSSPSSIRKSERLENRTSSTPPSVTRKSQRLEKQSTPSPLRRSDRGKTHNSSTFSASKSSEKVSSSLNRQKKKETKQKSVNQLSMGSVKVILGKKLVEESISLKRKRMDARSYKALFTKQRRSKSAPDSDNKLDRPDTLPRIDTVDSGGPKLFEDRQNGGNESGCMVVEDKREEPLRGASRGALLGSDCSLKECDAKIHFVGNCAACTKTRRLDYDSPKEELCSCRATGNWTLSDISRHKVSGNTEAAVYSKSVRRHMGTEQLKEILSGMQIDGLENVCIMCKKGGKLLCCDGESCKRCYHLSCLDPSLDDDVQGVWYCSYCVEKKIEFGIHTVSKGVESIWDVREVVESDTKGISTQKQYLVKYQGLAHVHNHWVPETQLLHESPSLVAEFNREHQSVRWNSEWRLPHRLLRKRQLKSSRLQDEYGSINGGAIPDGQFEWLVKWCGLDYDHTTWEVDSMSFLQSPQGQKLVREYEIRHQKAKNVFDKNSKEALLKLPVGGSPITDDTLLNNVNKLREFWNKNQSAIIFDEQDRLVNVILFILSLSDDHQPFLIVTTTDALSKWEAEFTKIAPSVDVVVYCGNGDTRKRIRKLEFYEEGGGIMLQVLLSTQEIVIEDINILKGIKWEAVIIDECQCSKITANVELIKMLQMNMRVLLFSGQLKDAVAEYQYLLSLLDSSGDLDKGGGLKSKNDSLVKLNESLSQFIAYGSKSDSSKFVEYWVPVPISNFQLEQYCATLFTNAIVLRSSLKKDCVGALPEILMSVRKCCNHPNTVDSSLQSFIKGLPTLEMMDVGIKASGKLQFLDMILSKIRRRKLRVLILFQSIAGSIGDVLDDFLGYRFGPKSYGRIDACLNRSKKQAALNRFNIKGSEQFVFLLENRACHPSIKLLSVDIVVIFDTDWNPANDIKALQKISIDSQSEQIKVFRLYSSYTVEEKLLILAKHHTNVENNLPSTSRTTSDTLLMWGAQYLFSRLDEYHAERSAVSAADVSSGQHWLLDDVARDFMAKLFNNSKNKVEHESIISKVFRGEGVYHTDCLLLGEREVQLTDGEERQIFWKKLLEGRNPQWKFLCGPTPRSRKRVQYFDESQDILEVENAEAAKKRQKVVDTCNSAPSFQPELVERGEVAGAEAVTNQSQPLPVSVTCTLDNANNASNLVSQERSFLHETDMAHPEQRTPSHEQKSLHTFLRAELAKLSEILKLSKNVKHTVQRFLEYVMDNHHVNNESASILQAFEMSLCWIAASVLKERIDRRDSLQLAKQILNFQCTYDEAIKVYLKLKKLKWKFMKLPENISDSVTSKNVVSALEDITEQPPNAGEPPSVSYNLQNVKVEVEEMSCNLEPAQGRAIHGVTANDLDKKIKKIKKKCDKRMLKLRLKHEEEIRELHKMCEQKKGQMVGEHLLELALIRTAYDQGAMRMDKLKISEKEFEKKIEEHELSMGMNLKELEARHAAIMEEESKRVNDWLAKMQSCISQCGDEELHSHCSESDYRMGSSEGSGHITSKGPENEVPRSGQNGGEQCPDGMLHVNQDNDVILSDISVTAAYDAFCCSVPSSETLPIRAVSDKALEIVSVEASSVVRLEQPEEPSQDSDRTLGNNAQDAVCCSLPADISPFLLTSASEKESEIVQVEASSFARAEQPQEANHLCDRTQVIAPKHSAHGVKEIDSVNIATTSKTSTIPSASDNALEIVPAETSSVAEVKEANQVSNRTLGINAQEAVGCSLPHETSPVFLNSTPETQLESVPLELSSLARAEQRKEANHLSHRAQETTPNCSSRGMDEIDSINLTTSIVQNEISSSGQDNGIPSRVPGTAGSETGSACTLEMGTCVESNIGDGRGKKMGSDGMGNQKGGTDSSLCETVTSKQIPSVDLVSEPTLTSSELLQGHDENLANMESVHTQDEDAPTAGEQTTIVGFARLTPVDPGCTLHSTCEAQGIENREQLRPVSNCSSPVYSQRTAAEAVRQGHMEGSSSLQTSQASPPMLERSVELSHQTVSYNGENLVLPPSTENMDSDQHHDYFNLDTINGTDHEPQSEPSARSQNTVASSQVVENVAEQPSLALLQSAPNMAIPEAPSHLPIHQSHRVGSWNPTLPLHAEPLQNELERIRKETEQIIKLHDITKLRINAECEEEIARVRSKYEARLKDAESALLLKKTELDSNQKMIVMNKLLAEAFQSKCLDLRPSGISAVQQAAPFSSIQPTRRHPYAATLSSAGQPATSQQTATSPVQSLYRSLGLFPSVPGRPPQISAITPSIGGLRGGGEIRAPAPHLQPFRPPACTPAASISCPPCNIPGQQVPANLPATSLSLPAGPTQQPLPLPSQFVLRRSYPAPPVPQPQLPVAPPPSRKNQALSTNRHLEPESGVQPGRRNPTLSAVELLIDIDNQASGHLPNILQQLAGSGLHTNALDPSDTSTSGDGNGCLTTSAIASDVVCLSDDDD